MSTSWTRRAVNILIGAAAGFAVAATVAPMAAWTINGHSSTSEGVGYGGDGDRLSIRATADGYQVTGSGFLASSTVDVAVGALEVSALADEVGMIDVHVPADDGLDFAETLASGVAADGAERVLAAGTGHSSMTGTPTLALASGAGAFVGWRWSRRRTQTVMP